MAATARVTGAATSGPGAAPAKAKIATAATATAATTTTTAPAKTAAAVAVAAKKPPQEGIDDICILRIHECFVYKVPARNASRGYRAEDWILDKPLATCELQLRAVRDDLVFRLMKDGKPFAESMVVPLNEIDRSKQLTLFVEGVVDSGRYFVIRFKDPANRPIPLGVGFRERSDAFDFNAAIRHQITQVQRHSELDARMAAETTAETTTPDDTPVEGKESPWSLKGPIRISLPKKKGGDVEAAGEVGGAEPDDHGFTAAPSSSSATVSWRASSSSSFTLAPPPTAEAAHTASSSSSSSSSSSGAPRTIPLLGAPPPPAPTVLTARRATPTTVSPVITPAASSGVVEAMGSLTLGGAGAGAGASPVVALPIPVAIATPVAVASPPGGALIDEDDDWGSFTSAPSS